jgi:hypothetical protein
MWTECLRKTLDTVAVKLCAFDTDFLSAIILDILNIGEMTVGSGKEKHLEINCFIVNSLAARSTYDAPQLNPQFCS